MSQTQSPLDPYRNQIEQWISEGTTPTNRDVIDKLAEVGVPTTDRSIRRALKRWDIVRPQTSSTPEPAKTQISGDKAELISEPSLKLNRPEDLMRERGLDPEEWEVISITINEWDGPTKSGGGVMTTGKQKLRQLKVHLRRVIPIDIVSPARVDGPVYQTRKSTKSEGPTKVVFVGDQQAPYHDTELHAAFCDFLQDFQPDKGVLIGDTIDLPDISRHPINPERDASTQECIDAAYGILRDYRESSDTTIWQKLAGNHDERLRRIVVDKIEKIYGLRRAEVPGEALDLPVLDIGHLLRLDELDIEFIRPEGDYEHQQINLSPYLAARHGWIARKGSGSSALATLEHLGYSVVVGHTHRQSLVHKTRHDINGQSSTLAACETGCMCEVDGLGYAVAPDWQQGFATAEIWPDGKFKLDLATFVNGNLYYRDKRY